jgi:SAM-dependent methyltransferase
MSAESAKLGAKLASDAYLRERLRPHWRDMNYLAFADLLELVTAFAAQLPVGARVFDYGCGGAPYDVLFSKCSEYVGADITPGPKVKVAVRPDGLTDEPPASYDALLSTQVLEHAPDPDAYLGEVRRLLRPGGRALISTHGLFEEHGCPYDFTRWTVIGLERICRRAGFEVEASHKLTTRIRGAVQLGHYLAETLKLPGTKTPGSLVLDLARRMHRNLSRPVFNLWASSFKGQGVVAGDDDASVYVGIAVRLRRPA